MSGKLAAKRALGSIYGRIPRIAPRRIVLLYHSLGRSPLALSAQDFRRQMEWLVQNADVVPLMEMLAGRPTAPLQAAVTFDDGYASLHDVALPILAQAGAVATVFLTTGSIGADIRQASDPMRGHYPDDEFMLWREAEALAAAGWGIAPHGVEHLDLTRQPEDRVRSELTQSRARIGETLGQPVPVFAYPWGRHSGEVRRLTAEAGYTHAVAGIHGPVTENSDPFAIPRIDIARDYTLDDFKAIVRGDWDYLGWLQRARAARRR